MTLKFDKDHNCAEPRNDRPDTTCRGRLEVIPAVGGGTTVICQECGTQDGKKDLFCANECGNDDDDVNMIYFDCETCGKLVCDFCAICESTGQYCTPTCALGGGIHILHDYDRAFPRIATQEEAMRIFAHQRQLYYLEVQCRLYAFAGVLSKTWRDALHLFCPGRIVRPILRNDSKRFRARAIIMVTGGGKAATDAIIGIRQGTVTRETVFHFTEE